MTQELDFSAAPTSAAIEVLSPGQEFAVIAASLLAFAAAIVLTVRVAMSASARSSLPPLPKLSRLPPSLRVVVAISLVSFLLIEAGGALDAYLMTRVVHGSAAEYFASISWVRLVGISHSHLFGYAFLYGLIACLAAFTSAAEKTKCIVASVLLWSGIFDVFSWWGIKALTPAFEWLAAATGAGTAITTLFAVWLIARELARRD